MEARRHPADSHSVAMLASDAKKRVESNSVVTAGVPFLIRKPLVLVLGALAVASLMATPATATAGTDREWSDDPSSGGVPKQYSLMIDPLEVLYGSVLLSAASEVFGSVLSADGGPTVLLLNLDFQYAVSRRFGIAVDTTAGIAFADSDTRLGVLLHVGPRFSTWGEWIRGGYLTPYASVAAGKLGDDRAVVFAGGGLELGHSWVWDNGFALAVGGGIGALPDSPNWQIFPRANFRLGFAGP
jgi:hypothetical protein